MLLDLPATDHFLTGIDGKQEAPPIQTERIELFLADQSADGLEIGFPGGPQAEVIHRSLGRIRIAVMALLRH